MRVSDIRKKYPEFFAEVETATWDSMREQFGRDKQFLKYCDNPAFRKQMRVVAYNAAATAVLKLHKMATINKETLSLLKKIAPYVGNSLPRKKWPLIDKINAIVKQNEPNNITWLVG